MEKQYNIKEAAEILGIAVRTVREWIKTRKISAHKYPNGKHLFIAQSEIDRIQSEMR